MSKNMRRVPIFSAYHGSRKQVKAIQDSLREVDINSTRHVACPIKQREIVEEHLGQYLSQRVPIVTVSRRTDIISAMISHETENPVISSRADYDFPPGLFLYYFSGLGTPDDVAVGSVIGPTPTAKYLQRIFKMMEKASDDMTIPFIGEKNKVTDEFCSMLENIGGGIRARQADYDEFDRSPVCVLFRHRGNDGAIDKSLRYTDSPVIITPKDQNFLEIHRAAEGTFQRGYHPEVAMVLGPRNAALYAAKLVGLYNDNVRQAVGRYSKKHSLV